MATCQSEDRVSLVSEVDIDLDQLEDSIKFFDLNNSTKTYLPHSNVSNQGDENDLETLKEHNEEARTTYPSYPKEKDDSPSSSVSVYSSSKSSSLLNGQGSVVWKNEDCGPDEIFRYVESLNVDESYIKDNRVSSLSEADCLDYTPLSLTFSSQSTPSPKDIPFVIDWVEVVGTKQRRGSSMWERMVGVKEHSMYCIKVVSGEKQWEVLRRYRDFIDLYHQLKRVFNPQTGTVLPSPTLEVGKSNQHYGNISPKIVEARSLQIQKYLQLLVKSGPPFSTASPLFWFLRPQASVFGNTGFEEHIMVGPPPFDDSLDDHLGDVDAPQRQHGGNIDLNQYNFGITMKLDLKIHSKAPLKQFLHAQQFSCAGCYKYLVLEKGMVQGFAQTITRGKPRFCEYTGQLFCSFCHLNEFAVLPAYVLRHWDFTPRRVSQLAKAYLNSIYDQSLLDISSLNPYLYSRVPILLHVKESRIKLSRVLSCMCRHAHGKIEQAMGSRRYLLENNDLFALRDLEDLSKGAFSALPPLLSSVLAKLVEHVTKQCSVCQDTGEWCGAGILCEDPFAPIFPFQEDNVSNCTTCNAPFHSKCFVKCTSCPACPKDWTNDQGHEGSQGDK